MTKRITIVIPDKIHKHLETWADEEGRSTANLAAFMVELSVRVKFPKEYPPAHKRDEENDQ